MPPEHYGGRHVLYVANYLAPDHAYMALSPDALFQRHLGSLERLYPGLSAADVDRKFVFTSSTASPVYDMGFGGRMPPFVGWSDGIGILGMSQVYPVDRNMNHCAATALACNMDELLGTRRTCRRIG